MHLCFVFAAFSPVRNAGALTTGDRFVRLLKEVMRGYDAPTSNSSAITGYATGISTGRQ